MGNWSDDLLLVKIKINQRLCGYMPFESEVNTVEFKRIVNGEYGYEERYWDGITEEGNSRVTKPKTLLINYW